VTVYSGSYISGDVGFYVNGTLISINGPHSGSPGAGFGSTFGVVPTGATYSAIAESYGSLWKWSELR